MDIRKLVCIQNEIKRKKELYKHPWTLISLLSMKLDY